MRLGFLSIFMLAGLFLTSLALSAPPPATRGISVIAKDTKTGESGEVPLYRKSWAVIVGIDRYPNLPPDKLLRYAVRDAKGVEDALRRNFRFDEIVTLTDEQATKREIMRLLTSELPRKMDKNDALFLFWAGHGEQEETAYGELGYLIPYDGVAGAIYTNITMTEIRDTISKIIPAKHAFYVMDACYSGLLATTRSLDTGPKRDLAYLREITRENVRQVLTAGSKGEEALDGGPGGHSVFTGRLIEALEAAGDFITANEIQTILREKVFQDARARNHTQTPGFGTLYGSGDFVFVPNTGQKAAEVAAELARLEQEKAELERREAEAAKGRDEAARRQAELQRQATEAKIRAEQMKQEQLAEEARRQEEQRREQARLLEEQQRLEAEMAARRGDEEQRLARLRAEVERKKSAVAGSTDTIEAAVAEIKRLAAEIDAIEAAFRKERQAGEQRIRDRYAALIAETRRQEQAAKGQPLVRDEFETEAEFQQRKSKVGGSFSSRVNELERQRDAELAELKGKADGEAQRQSAPLRTAMQAIAQREFPLDPSSVKLEVGTYNLERGEFPVSLNAVPGSPVKVALNGVISLPRDDAREWKQHLQAGFVRPEVMVRTGGELVRVALVDGASDDLLMTILDGRFVSVREKREQERAQREQTERARQERERRLNGEFVLVKGGCFQMGDIFGDGSKNERPVHQVCVGDFSMGKHEVTQEQWQAVMGNNPSKFPGGDRPVEQVSWDDAQAYIRKLNKQTGKNYRLPTEAEWEYACRSGGKNEKYCGGDNADRVAWHNGNSGGNAHPGGEKQPNGLGLYDMSGNVWEWVQDTYHDSYGGFFGGNAPTDGSAWEGGGSYRVFRGGCWGIDPWNARSANRARNGPASRTYVLGFRLAFPPVR